MKKKSFLIHIDSLDVLDDLTVEQCGELLKAIKAFHFDEDVNLSPLVKIAFSPFKNQFIRDNEKYQKTCKARAKAGSKGGKAKQANLAKGGKPKQKVANLADNDNKNDSDNVNGSDNKNKNFDFKSELLALGIDEQTVKDWMTVRQKKKAANTITAFNGLVNQINKSNLTPQEAVRLATERSWIGFNADWVDKQSKHDISNQNYQSGKF